MTCTVRSRGFARSLPRPNRVARERIERLLALASYLEPADRWLIEQVYEHGRLPVQIAKEQNQSVQRVRYRLRKLIERMRTKRYRFVANRMDCLPSEAHAAVRAMVLHGKSQNETAKRMRLTRHRVREYMQMTDALMRCVG